MHHRRAYLVRLILVNLKTSAAKLLPADGLGAQFAVRREHGQSLARCASLTYFASSFLSRTIDNGVRPLSSFQGIFPESALC